jgi:hypothetical protein
MQRETSMKTMFRTVTATIGVGVVGALFATSANASCANTPKSKATHAAWMQPQFESGEARFTPAVYRPGEADFTTLTQVSDEATDSAPIVGLWEFEVHLSGAQNGLPDNALFDWGLATWHDDGTEIQFSAGRPPSAGDVCMGVWKQVGRSKFKLHHIALGLTPPDSTGSFIGPAIIDASVTVDPSGKSYTGRYTISIYPGSPDDGTEFNESGAPLVGFVGTITAKRVTPN